jgi:tRNA pseudouridine-54 N-methylase
MKNILFDKDDYTQIEKQESNPVKTILNRQGEINNESKEIKKKLEKILQMSTLTTMMNHTISLLHQSLDKDKSK